MLLLSQLLCGMRKAVGTWFTLVRMCELLLLFCHEIQCSRVLWVFTSLLSTLFLYSFLTFHFSSPHLSSFLSPVLSSVFLKGDRPTSISEDVDTSLRLLPLHLFPNLIRSPRCFHSNFILPLRSFLFNTSSLVYPFSIMSPSNELLPYICKGIGNWNGSLEICLFWSEK